VIDGVTVKPLARFPDERGTVMKMLQATDPEFKGFGEVYFSTVLPGAVKAWRRHPLTWLSYCVVRGTIKVVLFDDRTDSPTRGEYQEIVVGDDNYCLIQIPPGVWNGFQGLGPFEAIICDVTDRPYADDVTERLAAHANGVIAYDWQPADR
jgi:dTDP-4-dehydrorhamnose 3,5-epimerase